MIEIEAFTVGKYTATRSVGSSFRLREELKAIGTDLQLDWQENLGLVDPQEDESTAAVSGEEDAQLEPMEAVKAAATQLSQAAELSCTHRLPIIFDG